MNHTNRPSEDDRSAGTTKETKVLFKREKSSYTKNTWKSFHAESSLSCISSVESLEAESEDGPPGNTNMTKGDTRPQPFNLERNHLQSKDSFANVSECLTRKRSQILNLWEQANRAGNRDPQLMDHFEFANSLGDKSAALLEQLKIYASRAKEGNSEDDTILKQLRDQVLQYLKLFENEHQIIHDVIGEGHSKPRCHAQVEQPETLDLNQLDRLYSQQFPVSAPPPPRVAITRVASEPLSSSNDDKCRKLEEKICEQQDTVKTLEHEIKRVEEQHSLDLKLLKSNMNDKLDDLGSFPDILHMAEMKLAQCLAKIAVLEKDLTSKDSQNVKLEKQLQDHNLVVQKLTDKLRLAECENHHLKGRLDEVGAMMTTQCCTTENVLKAIQSNMGFARSNDQTDRQLQELEQKLNQAKKQALHYKKSKDEIVSKYNSRMEELMETLESSRRKNQLLRNQLRLIRTSYHQLFPTNQMFSFFADPEQAGHADLL